MYPRSMVSVIFFEVEPQNRGSPVAEPQNRVALEVEPQNRGAPVAEPKNRGSPVAEPKNKGSPVADCMQMSMLRVTQESVVWTFDVKSPFIIKLLS